MTTLSNLHMHTIFSDGKNTAEEYVAAALEKGFDSIGFSDHGPAPYDSCQLPLEMVPAYLDELECLKQKYANQIEIYTGIETDYYNPICAPLNRKDFDYIIGSVHFIKAPDDNLYCIDYLPEYVEQLIELFGGAAEMVREYYKLVADTALTQKPDILGHMDLIKKLNLMNCFFNPAEKWYCAIVDEAIDSIAQSDCIVEVNTGGIGRGYLNEPYPSEYILKRLYAQKVPVTITSDAHTIDKLDCAFDAVRQFLTRVGYQSVKQLKDGCFVDVPL